MQFYYNGEHQVLFGEIGVARINEHGEEVATETNLKYSWNDFHLVPTSRPVIAPPPVKKSTIEIIGANSQIDLTDVPRGFPTYGNRTGTLDFYVDHSQEWNGKPYDWLTAYNDLKAYLHGYKMKVYLGDDIYNYYYGRLEINNWKSDKNLSTISINYDFDPYMLSSYSTLDEWLWDPFNFERGIIPDNDPGDYTHDLSEGHAIVYPFSKVGSMPVTPTIHITEHEGPLYAQVFSSYTGRWSPIVRIDSGVENLGFVLSTPRSVDSVQMNFYSDASGTPATSGIVAIDYRIGRL